MEIRYIFHSGFLAETDEACYIFDYYRGALPDFDPKKRVTVLSSHAHPDHYNPEIFKLLAARGIQNVLAVPAQDIPQKKLPKDVETLRVRANERCTLPGGETLETLASTDSGVAFLLTNAEGVIYHAGDLNDWFWEGESESDNQSMRARYRRQIDLLAGRAIDIACVPLDPRLNKHYADGMLYFLETTAAKSVYPMHYWKQPACIRRFLNEYPQYQGRVITTE